jgi:hypothetical protein
MGHLPYVVVVVGVLIFPSLGDETTMDRWADRAPRASGLTLKAGVMKRRCSATAAGVLTLTLTFQLTGAICASVRGWRWWAEMEARRIWQGTMRVRIPRFDASYVRDVIRGGA